MKILRLNKVPFDELIDCFLLAFKEYHLEIPTDKMYYQKRWSAAKVDYNLSYGMLINGQLVGFIIHAIDNRFGKKTAFNTGTGVIPDFRGNGISKLIYDYAINDLRNHGIEKCILEVIQENKNAIKIYQRSGFKICKEYQCFSGNINIKSRDEINLKKVSKEDFNWDNTFNQEFYSWDFQKETIIERNYDYYYVIHDNQLESYFIYNEENKYVAQFDLLADNNNAWERLFQGIKLISNNVKIVNVDTRLLEKLEIINKVEIPTTVNQYEMKLEIN
ncbi:GNAT family N-acetyltransferase [Flammeovirga kamogawensis]|uniref:GNAT family N-acetyltransferase n=1 Tax=Flammeovirga kamogawensis TaxID=373891 RepID=A0ABX8GU49_9BACT|nr:GNAT family N-acetyltransferase [Flammeovirga kamogawensis]MBB6460065.1 GNAT superfamily N-acetyltransferase [Flammeovirga kamogawensis]QWG06891.1 GNAT family N-acetyltransferase [Flammeovirga kamogawensis]TRX68712.1 GNAT family N-acetyltransferase [Flammeovirga kamogawensis]